jgi:hypothetical protein
VSFPTALRFDLRVPYSMQWNATVEREHWNTGFRLSYIGTNTRQGEYTYNINQPLADSRPFVDKPRRFPNYPAINYRTNGAGHQYHALSAEMERQMASGVFYQISWTWARDIGDLERGESPENAYDRARERSVLVDIPTHRITSSVVYQLPFGKGKRLGTNAGRFLNGLIGGWQLSAIYYQSTGPFLTPAWTGPDPTGTRYTASRTPAQVTLRPNILRDANLPSDQRTLNRWFDTGAFAPPTLGSFGTSAKGVIKGPGSKALHGGIYKIIPIRERLRLRWELSASNLANHPNWGDPGLNISTAGTVGVIRGMGSAGASQYDEAGTRSFRTALRLEW